MLACARIGAIHSVVFGGFAAKELATRIDDAEPKVDPVRVLRHRGGARSCPTSRCSTRRIALAATSRGLPHPAAAAGRSGPRRRARPRLGARPSTRRGQRAGRPPACPSPRPTRSTSSTPPARPGRPKGVVRDNGGHMVALKWSMANLYGVEPGEVFWAASDVGWVVGHSYIVYAPLLHGCTSDALRGQAGRHAGCGRLLAGHRRARRRRPVHGADRLPRDQEGGSGRRASSPDYDLSRFRALFLAGERADPDTVQWAEGILGDAGDRPLVADRDRLADRRQSRSGSGRCRSSTARRRCRCPATTSHVLDEGGRPVPAEHDGLDRHQAAAAARLPADALAGGRALPRQLPRGLSGLLQHFGRGLHRRGRLRLRHGPHGRHHQRRRPPALDRRHGGGAGLASRPSPNAPSSASGTRSRARCPAASWC